MSLKIRVIDSHTGGEPTRVVLDGGPNLGSGPLSERCARLRSEYDRYRSAMVNEPRGSDVLVGALLVEPHEADCAAGAIFFNNVGTLAMCGHAMIGVTVTLAHLGRIGPGLVRIDTPAGPVGVEYHGGSRVTISNVPSFRAIARLTVDVPGIGPVVGDVAWGGNWFFLTSARDDIPIEVGYARQLTDYAMKIRHAVDRIAIPLPHPGVIDHIELVGPAVDSRNHARNFVLCPGGAFDRSPCGTGTSAKLACLAAEGRLAAGEVWRQESILGSVFGAEYTQLSDGRILPRITGDAYITGEATLLLHPDDPFCWGFRT